MSTPLNRQELFSAFKTATNHKGAEQSAKNYLLFLIQQQAAQSEFGVIGAAVPEADGEALWAIRADGMARGWGYAGKGKGKGKGNGEEINLFATPNDAEHISLMHLAGVLEFGVLINQSSDFLNNINIPALEFETWGKTGLDNIREKKVKP